MSDLSRLEVPRPKQLGDLAHVWQDRQTTLCVRIDCIQAFFPAPDTEPFPQFIGTTLQILGKHVWVAHSYESFLEFMMGVNDDAA